MMKKYRVEIDLVGTIYVDAKNEESAFNKAIKLEKEIKKLLKENGFNEYSANCVCLKEVKEE